MSKLVFLPVQLEKAEQPETRELSGPLSEAPSFWGGTNTQGGILGFFWFVCGCSFWHLWTKLDMF